MKKEEKISIQTVFNVLGNPTRLRIFNILMTGVHCNCEIAEQMGLAMNLVSHHLKALQKAELVLSERSEKDARWVYYAVNEKKLVQLQEDFNNFFDPNRIVNREPVCPPCNVKKSKENCK